MRKLWKCRQTTSEVTGRSVVQPATEAEPELPGTFPCVCCGYMTMDEPPGSYNICSICFWEDDHVQLRYPELGGGANGVSLIEGQRMYAAIGACKKRILQYVRPVAPTDIREESWRPIDLERDVFESWDAVDGRSAGLSYFLHAAGGEASDGVPEGPPDDETRMYWWRSTFWNSSRRDA